MAGMPEKNKGGRPSVYHKSFEKIAYELCRQHGYTDEKLAELLGGHLSTLKNWKAKHGEFLSAIRRGKDEFDGEHVESALLKRAKGFIRKRLVKRTVQRAGLQQTETTEVIEEVEGSVRAQEVYLYNRNPERWKRIPTGTDESQEEQDSVGVLVVPQREDYNEWLRRLEQGQSNTE
jgi:hypothetical protein